MRETNRLATTRYGRFLYNPSDIYIGKALEEYGEAHEFEVMLLRQLCAPGACIFDVGANIGDHTLPLAQHAGEHGFVYAFEPQPVVFELLRENVAMNGLRNVECVNAAVGQSHGTVLIPEFDYTVEGNYGGVEVSRFTDGQSVRQVMLDDYFDARSADLVKIDVEGMEAAVLRGGTKFLAKFRPVLYVENDRVAQSPELIRLLHSLEYRVFWHVAPLFNPDNFRGSTKNLFENVVATNLLCVPRETPLEFSGPAFPEALDASKHPFGNWP